MSADLERFKNLTFDGFRTLAQDDSLTQYEKIGFPDSYRKGKEDAIFGDIARKLTSLRKPDQVVLDIGPGCSGLAFQLIELCRQQGNKLLLVDSAEMLSHLPDESFIYKTAGRYPQDCGSLLKEYAGSVNAILTYSVLQYVFVEASVFDFVDQALALLAGGGEMLIGDIPNVSMRKRFFSSPHGIEFHQQYTNTDEIPAVHFNDVETGNIDDSVVLALLARARNAGAHAFVMPQAAELPMANRREDILIVKP